MPEYRTTRAVDLLLVTVLLVMNTVRIAAFARRRETSIMRSVGASNATIRLPFITEALSLRWQV